MARYGSRIMLHVVDNSERNEPRKVEVTKALGLTFVLDRAELLGILYENQILNVAQKLRIRRAAR